MKLAYHPRCLAEVVLLHCLWNLWSVRL